MLVRYGSTVFLILFAVYALTLVVPYGYATTGLDPSWNLAINLLIQQGATFGQDVGFTYGPLGFLNYRIMPEGYSIYWFLIFDLSLVGMATASLAYALRRAGKHGYWMAILAVILFYPDGLFADRVFSLLFYEFAFILYAFQERRFWALLPAGLIAVLLFFIKVNVLFFAGPIYLVFLAYGAWKRIFSPSKLGVLAIFYIVFLLSLAHLWHVDIPNYVKNSIELTDGYLEAMSAFQLYLKEFFSLALVEILLWLGFAYLVWISRSSWKQNGLVLLCVGLLFLLAFKQSHVGIGFAGFRNFFRFYPCVILLYWVFLPVQWDRVFAKVGIGLLLIQFVGVMYTGYGLSGRSWSTYLRARPIPHMNLAYYFVPYSWYDYGKNFEPKALNLPEALRRRIGTGSVDFLQHDLAYVFFNRLRYQPRPVIQSYSAYTPELIRMNGEHYRSAKAPEWVFFKLEAFRNQNPFWMDAEVTLELLKRYQLLDSVLVGADTLQVFRRGGGISEPPVRELVVSHMELGKSIRIPAGGLVRLKVDAQLNVLGKCMRLFVQAPYLYANVRYRDGSSRRFRVIPSVLRSGIWVGGRVLSQSELHTFFQTAGRGSIPAEEVVLSSSMAWAWE